MLTSGVKRCLNIFFYTVIILYTVYGLRSWRSNYAWDFYQFWIAGQAINDMNITNLYSKSELKRIDEFYFQKPTEPTSSKLKRLRAKHQAFCLPGTPFQYAVFYFISTGKYDIDYQRYNTASTLFYVGGIVGMAVFLGYSSFRLFCLLIALTKLSWPFHILTVVGNVAGIQIGMVALILGMLSRKEIMATLTGGLLFGLLSMFKPNVVFALPLLALLWWRDKKIKKLILFMIGVGGGGIIGFVFPVVLFGSSCEWPRWFTDHSALLYNDWTLTGGFLGKLIHLKNVSIYGYWGLFLLGLVAAWVVRSVRMEATPERLRHSEFTMMALGLGIYVLSGPVVHAHYILLNIPLILLVMRPRETHPQSEKFFLTIGGVALILICTHPLLKNWGLTNDANHSLWTFFGSIIMMVLTCADFYYCRAIGFCR